MTSPKSATVSDLDITVSGLYALVEIDDDDEIDAKARNSIVASGERLTRTSVERALNRIRREKWRKEREAEEAKAASAKNTDAKAAKAAEAPARKLSAMVKKAETQRLIGLLRQLLNYQRDDPIMDASYQRVWGRQPQRTYHAVAGCFWRSAA